MLQLRCSKAYWKEKAKGEVIYYVGRNRIQYGSLMKGGDRDYGKFEYLCSPYKAFLQSLLFDNNELKNNYGS